MEKNENEFKDFSLLNTKGPSTNPFDDGLRMDINLDDSGNSTLNDKKEEKQKEDVIEEVEEKEEKVEATDTEEKEEIEEKEEKVELNEEEETTTNSLTVFAEFLNDEGLISLEEGKKVETEEDLKGAIQNTITKGIEEYKSTKPEDVQKFLDFVDAGGDPRQFHRLYYEQMSWSDVDPSKEGAQELIIREAYSQAGWDPEDIEAEISDKKDLGRLGPLAEKLHKKLVAAEAEEKQTLIQAQKEHKIKQEEAVKKQWDDFKTDFYALEDLNGFKLTPKQKDELWAYMAKADRKTGKTGLQTHNETNAKAQYLYAYLAMNNWDINSLEKQVKNKVVSKLADKLKNSGKSQREKLGSGTANNLGDEKKNNNFSSFRTALEKGNI